MTKSANEGPNKGQAEQVAKLLSDFGNQITAINKQMEADHLVQPAIDALEAASNQFVVSLKTSIHSSPTNSGTSNSGKSPSASAAK